MFGDNDEGYQSMISAYDRQLEMVIGEFPWKDQPTLLYRVYFIFYILVIFITMLNFVLAVIAEQYEGMKDAIRECKIENSFLEDISFTFLYYRRSFFRGWP